MIEILYLLEEPTPRIFDFVMSDNTVTPNKKRNEIYVRCVNVLHTYGVDSSYVLRNVGLIRIAVELLLHDWESRQKGVRK